MNDDKTTEGKLAEPETTVKQRYLLINYTGDGYHWGCYATSHALTRSLLQRGSLATISVSQNGQFKLGDVALARAYATAPEFSEKHPQISEKIHDADVVVVNGEGTLHGSLTAGPIALLTMMRFAKAAGKTVHLVNHSCFPSDTIERCPADAAYVSILKEIDSVVVRDVASQEFYRRNGIPAVLGFDCLPLYYDQVGGGAAGALTPRGHITVIGGVTMSVGRVAEVIDLMLARYGDDCKITYLYGSAGNLAREDKIAEDDLGQRFLLEDRFELVNAGSFEEFMAHIRGSRLLVTGRFHYAIAAMSCKTPFVAFTSNTPKTETVVKEHGYEGDVLDPDAPFSETLLPVLDSFDNGRSTLVSATPLKTLVELASRNLDFARHTSFIAQPDAPEEILQDLAKGGQHRVLADYWAALGEVQISFSCRASVAKSLYVSKRYREALAQCELILERQPNARGVILTKMNCLIELGLIAEAKAEAMSAIQRFPAAVGVLAGAAAALNKAADAKAATAVAEQVLALDASNKTALLIAARHYLTFFGDFEKAAALLRRYLAVDPYSPIANVQLGMALAQTGVDGEAFDYLAFRNEMAIVKLRHREADYNLPKWDGTPLSGRLLVRPEPENGVGYEALCSTFIPELHDMGQSFSFAIQSRFRPYFESVFPAVDFVDVGEELKARTYEAEVHFRDLCKLRRRSRKDFARSQRHFRPLGPRVDPPKKMRVGLSWHTASNAPSQTLKRSIPLSGLSTLFEIDPERLQWVNLQYGAVDEEIEKVERELGVSIEHEIGCDFVQDNTAFTRAMDSVDVVVTIDNSTVFFAGLKRKPTLLMVPYVSHWIWGKPDKASRWYPSVEILRQQSWGDWNEVIDEARGKLISMLHSSA